MMKIRSLTLNTMFFISSVSMFTDCVAQENNGGSFYAKGGSSSRLATLPTETGRMETYFVNIKDNDVVRTPFRVIFGITGLGIAPAGTKKEGTGHHHLFIDSKIPLDMTKPIPFSDNYRHYGGGQTEAVLELAPGKHTLQLVFADADHRPVFKTKNGSDIIIVSKKITITVEGAEKTK